MIAGHLKLYGMQGIFYDRMLHSSDQTFETSENKLFDGTADFDRPELETASRAYFTPLDVDGITEYVTGSFTDDFKTGDNYKVTIWLLVEEWAMPTDENCNTNCDG